MPIVPAEGVSHAVEEDESMHVKDVAFRIEDCDFRVPIQMFRESKTFCDMLEKATSQDPDARRSAPLDRIGKDDFRYFLKFMYQRQFGGKAKHNAAVYTALLKLSTNWRFKSVRETVIRDFPNIDLVDKIVLSRDYCVKEWFISSLDAYVRLRRSITLQDVEKLGLDYILKIVEIRDNQDHSLRRVSQSSLRSLFCEEIKQSRFEPSSPVASNVEDFDLVDIYFLVENRLFKSYRQCFEISPIFNKMFSLPVGTNMPDGHSKSQPLQLEGIKRADFAPFVALINPGASGGMSFSLEQWISILKLSTMWDFLCLRQYSISELSKFEIPPARRIDLARACRIQEWLLPALNDYAIQFQSITAEDVDLLGWHYVLRILQARDDRPVNSGTVIEARASQHFYQALNETFSHEIRRVESYGVEDKPVSISVAQKGKGSSFSRHKK